MTLLCDILGDILCDILYDILCDIHDILCDILCDEIHQVGSVRVIRLKYQIDWEVLPVDQLVIAVL